MRTWRQQEQQQKQEQQEQQQKKQQQHQKHEEDQQMVMPRILIIKKLRFLRLSRVKLTRCMDEGQQDVDVEGIESTRRRITMQ